MAVGATRRKLVALRALGLGDFLTGVPALRALADAYPEHRRVLAAPNELTPLVALLGGVIDAVVDTDFRRGFRPLDAGLSRADVAVNLHGCGPSSHRTLLDTGANTLIAFAHPDISETVGSPRWRADEHEVARWCRLLAEHGIACDPARLHLDVPVDTVPESARGATLLHAGAASPARRWPVERWAAVARAESRSGRRVLLTGSPAERPLAESVQQLAGLPSDVVVAGRTDLLTLAGLVAVAGRVVCGDTGVAHLATAVGTPSTVLFGPVSPARWGPPASAQIHHALWAGRTGDPHGSEADPGLLEITVPDVLETLARLEANSGV